MLHAYCMYVCVFVQKKDKRGNLKGVQKQVAKQTVQEKKRIILMWYVLEM